MGCQGGKRGNFTWWIKTLRESSESCLRTSRQVLFHMKLIGNRETGRKHPRGRTRDAGAATRRAAGTPTARNRGPGGGIGRGKWRSRPVSRVLSWTVIPLGPASPQASSSQPGRGTSHAIAPLFGLAPGGVCRAPRRWPRGRWALTPPFHPYHAPSRAVRRFVFCCTFRRLAPPRRYLAPCSVEPGLSSAHCCDATVWPAPPWRIVSQGGFQRPATAIRRTLIRHPRTGPCAARR